MAEAYQPVLVRMLPEFERRTGLPWRWTVGRGRPMAGSLRDALEPFGSAPVDLLTLGPFVVCREAA